MRSTQIVRTWNPRRVPLLTTLFCLVLAGCGDEQSISTLVDPDHPRVVGAVSQSNTTVLVSFNEQVAGGMESAENPGHYQITEYTVSSGVSGGSSKVHQKPYLGISGVTLSADGKSVVLQTLSQSDIEYTLTVTNVKDLQGNPLAGSSGVDSPATARFVGTPPSQSENVDSDSDGLTDSAEQRGWTVTVLLVSGAGQQKAVTSDPFTADTDGDGITDATEKHFGIDPRSSDTDADGLSDLQELVEIYSDASRQDTDGDTLTDGLEFNSFKTSPILADSDGDQIEDSYEIKLGNRNPRMADLPLPGIEIGDVDLRLDVRFRAQTTTGTRDLETKQVSTTIKQTDTRTFSKTDAKTNEFFAKYATSEGASLKGLSYSTTIEGGYTRGWNSSVRKESAEQAQKAYQDSLTTQVQSTRDETVTREVLGASIKAIVNIESLGDIAFTIRNVQIAVLMQDPRSPDRLLPLATLVPDPASGTPNEFSLGPLISVRGPLVFSNQQVFPSLVEDLMRDPRGLMFKIANYDIEDEFGRNFAYTSQGINDRTGSLVIDFGLADLDGDGEGEDTERMRIATGSGRVIGDTNGDGLINEHDRRVVFDANGRHVGITVRDALENVLGLTRYDEEFSPSNGLTQSQLSTSYSTRLVPFDADEDGQPDGSVEMLWRVREVSRGDNPLKAWEVLTPMGIDRSVDLSARVIGAAEGLVFAFVQDLDNDRIPARWESIYGCSDSQEDTDGDGLADYEEVFGGWVVSVAGQRSFRGYGSCARADSDLDGIGDLAEARRTVDVDTDGDGVPDVFDVAAPTDAKNSDTDGDGIGDYAEQNGYFIDLRFDIDAADTHCSVPDVAQPRRAWCMSDPLDPDTDGDTLSDGDEVQLGTDPTSDDGDKFFDNDGDGLVNFFEQQIGWQISYVARAKTCAELGNLPDCKEAYGKQGESVQYVILSDPNEKDADRDDLTDRQERDLGTDPYKADTDEDGLEDGVEVVVTYLPNGQLDYEVKTDPLDADVDNDLRSDGEEVSVPWIVAVTDKVPVQVYSDPNNADKDFDGLPDYGEFLFGTHPEVFDTDGDDVGDAAEVDAARNTNPLTPDQRVEFYFTNLHVTGACEGGQAGDVGEFYGKWFLEFNADREEIYSISNKDLRQGSDYALGNDPRTYVMKAGDRVRASVEGVREDDTGGDQYLTDVSETFDYEVDGTVALLTSVEQGNEDECKLETTLRITIR